MSFASWSAPAVMVTCKEMAREVIRAMMLEDSPYLLRGDGDGGRRGRRDEKREKMEKREKR